MRRCLLILLLILIPADGARAASVSIDAPATIKAQKKSPKASVTGVADVESYVALRVIKGRSCPAKDPGLFSDEALSTAVNNQLATGDFSFEGTFLVNEDGKHSVCAWVTPYEDTSGPPSATDSQPVTVTPVKTFVPPGKGAKPSSGKWKGKFVDQKNGTIEFTSTGSKLKQIVVRNLVMYCSGSDQVRTFPVVVFKSATVKNGRLDDTEDPDKGSQISIEGKFTSANKLKATASIYIGESGGACNGAADMTASATG